SCTVAALAALAVACGGPAGPSEEAGAWTNRVCDALYGFTRAATTAPQIDPAGPVAAVPELDRYLAATSDELQRSLTALGTLRRPPRGGAAGHPQRLRHGAGATRRGRREQRRAARDGRTGRHGAAAGAAQPALAHRGAARHRGARGGQRAGGAVPRAALERRP